MKCNVILLGGILLLSTSVGEAKFFANTGITKDEFISCWRRTDQKKCQFVVESGCKTVCLGASKRSNLGHACQELCTKLPGEALRIQAKRTIKR